MAKPDHGSGFAVEERSFGWRRERGICTENSHITPPELVLRLCAKAVTAGGWPGAEPRKNKKDNAELMEKVVAPLRTMPATLTFIMRTDAGVSITLGKIGVLRLRFRC